MPDHRMDGYSRSVLPEARLRIPHRAVLGGLTAAVIATAFGLLLLAGTAQAAAPTLTLTATPTAVIGQTISATATISATEPTAAGVISFEVFGSGDPECLGSPLETVPALFPVSGDGPYESEEFEPPSVGVYHWRASYPAEGENPKAESSCVATSTVGPTAVTLAVGATGGTVGTPVGATATIQGGLTPTGEITFKAFPPGDANCSGSPAFSSVVGVSGDGSYGSAAILPSRAGNFRWAISYSGDVNNSPAAASCGEATSSVSKAAPSIDGLVKQQLTVGASFQDTATLLGGYAPTGTITFKIYGPVASGCAKPAFVDTVKVAGNGTYSSDPFVALSPGRYSFVASYSGDAANQAANEPCDSAGQEAKVQKRTPKVKPRGFLMGSRRISIRAHLSGATAPSGAINFRLYRPGDRHCRRKPAFSGSITVKSNGNYSLAKYFATRSGTYRLSVGYSGDRRNRKYKGKCSGAQSIRVG